MRVLGYSHSVACSNAAKYRATSEWDTAAGEAIARFAGGTIVNLKNKPLRYNSCDKFINPNFIVSNHITNKEKILSML